MTAEVFLARQSVVDADRLIFGYELLHRADLDHSTPVDDPDVATRGVMERLVLQWGMEHVVGDRFGLINASASLIVHGLHRAMPPEGIIIEVREPEPFDDDTLGALQQARYDGYHFALDNVSRLGELERSRLLPLASIVKIELTTAQDAEIPGLIAVAREHSPGVLVVAEKVESVADFKRCVEHGFDLFQGYYIAAPEVLRRPARPAGTRSAAVLQQTLSGRDGHLDVDKLESVLASDPSLAFRLLTAVNTNAFGLNRNVRSLDQAMDVLGTEKLRCLAELIAASPDTIDDDTQITKGAERAHMAAELLAGTDQVGSGVTVALLSTTDQFYGAPIAELLDELPVTDEIVAAVLHGQGRLGEMLDIIRACEQNDTATLEELAPGRTERLLAMRDAAVDAVADASAAAQVQL